MSHDPKDIIRQIASVANAVGFQAGEPAMEIAGQIVSVLAANPEKIDRFMEDGTGTFMDELMHVENGCLSYRAMSGETMTPARLRASKRIQPN